MIISLVGSVWTVLERGCDAYMSNVTGDGGRPIVTDDTVIVVRPHKIDRDNHADDVYEVMLGDGYVGLMADHWIRDYCSRVS